MADTFTATALQGETLDALCWRVLGQTENVVDQALELNRGLADQDIFLTEGQVILLPVQLPKPVPQQKIVQLWS
ncbi:tail protein X [Sphingopyxis yananensis]|uniref:tail protein X n=1 Tax=Sphingopyxis yananensis TaxID=2886687 RepID=UPI001D0F5885|nr:tail protein X [Sphingopyxis yananensis]MCC2602757.1 tail protein X [Sphingopyxis yananensis]